MYRVDKNENYELKLTSFNKLDMYVYFHELNLTIVHITTPQMQKNETQIVFF